MTTEATSFLAAALKSATINGSFSPADIGAKIGLNKFQAEAAARSLANNGVLSLGFDSAAHFTPEYRKSQAGKSAKAAKPAKKTRKVAKVG
jgi:hypothetical protein